jgi:hypothetical protein
MTVICLSCRAGPCWLEIENPDEQPDSVSWCKFDVEVKSMASVRATRNAPESPPLVVASLSLKTCINPATGNHEICVASVLISDTVAIDGARVRLRALLCRARRCVRRAGIRETTMGVFGPTQHWRHTHQKPPSRTLTTPHDTHARTHARTLLLLILFHPLSFDLRRPLCQDRA